MIIKLANNLPNVRINMSVVSLCIALSACSTPAPPSAEVQAYLDEAVEVIRANALSADRVDWDEVRRGMRHRAAGAQSAPAAYEALRYALESLGDAHSFLQLSDSLRAAEVRARPQGAAPEDSSDPRIPPTPYGSRMQPEQHLHAAEGVTIAHVFMPQGRRNAEFADRFQRMIAELDASEPCGWIVDLRGNGGGDMWPMLAGLGPVLGDGIAGRMERPGESDRWLYESGEAVHLEADGDRIVRIRVEDPYQLAGHPPVAVLIDRGTASSGEAMAVSFKGRRLTRTFGERTYGASTATRGFPLSDGANMVLAVATFADRDGTVYADGVPPDEIIPVGDTIPGPEEDPVVQAAILWLLSSCGGERK